MTLRGLAGVGFAAILAAAVPAALCAQVPPQTDLRIYDIVAAASAERVESDIRTLAGFGKIEGVDFDYAAKMTALNAAVLAQLAWAPPAPANIGIGGAVRPSTTLQWEAVDDPRVAGYKVYWRDTTSPRWQHSRWVGDVTEFTLEDLVIDNYLFGVATIGHDGNESVVAFPSGQIPRRWTRLCVDPVSPDG